MKCPNPKCIYHSKDIEDVMMFGECCQTATVDKDMNVMVCQVHETYPVKRVECQECGTTLEGWQEC